MKGDAAGAASAKRLTTINVGLLSCVSLWAYASYRNDGFNVGGQVGDIDFWITMRDLGSYGSVVGVLVALWAAASAKLGSVTERICWLLLPLFGAPLLLVSLSIALRWGIPVAH